jgi:hypothetical protein
MDVKMKDFIYLNGIITLSKLRSQIIDNELIVGSASILMKNDEERKRRMIDTYVGHF